MVADVSALYLIRVGEQVFVRLGTPAVAVTSAMHGAKFNPSHDNAGRFARRQGAQSAAIRTAEDSIATSNVEHAIVLNTKGEVVFRKDGERSSVSFTDADVGKMKDCVLTHNHPGGASLSDGDIVLAMRGDVSQMRAVTTQYRHSLDRPDGGWPKGTDAQARVIRAYGNAERAQYLTAGIRIQSGQLTPGEARRVHHHETMERFASEMKWSYKRELR